ncbi:ABC transporter ATP-binding protein [Paenibacillus sp. IB182496]|uniref:ABC transporter ATP-binding protein n=1 Tax=Paenibacillus sabuli TaxID=2772509 RepID=A0A927BWK8_9BACL|nr:ABC transporter ATP-binding protein [Paenibacillus sabuli]MBD2846789.1 ABC transporter ATP-binding protein [Paenibacillus sabuli]
MIEATELTKTIGGRRVLGPVSFELPAKGMYGVIGPNGAGKSTLLSLLSGVLAPDSGHLSLRGRPSTDYRPRELARWVAVLEQDGLPRTTFSVREVVEMARFPFQNWLGDEPGDPASLVAEALRSAGLEPFADRRMDRLSGGERQRVALAKVIAQQPELILLDEPTTFLDIGYQVQLLDTVRAWQRRQSLTVVAVLHDLNLAAQYCDRLLVVKDGAIVAEGTPEQVVTTEMIRSVYGTDAIVLPHPVSGRPQVLLQPATASPPTAGLPSAATDLPTGSEVAYE